MQTTQRSVTRFSLTKTGKASKRICTKFQFASSDRWEKPFNEDKVLQVGTRNKKFDSDMRGVKLKSLQCVKDLGVNIVSNLKFSQQCIDATNKVNRMLGFIKRNFLFKNKDVILPLS